MDKMVLVGAHNQASERAGQEQKCWAHAAWIQIPGLPLTSCVALATYCNSVRHGFFILEDGKENNALSQSYHDHLKFPLQSILGNAQHRVSTMQAFDNQIHFTYEKA